MSLSARHLLALSAPAALFIACSSSGSGSSTTGSGGTSAASTSAASTSGSTTSSSASGTGGAAACQQNCITTNSAAYAKFQGYLLADCGCASGAPCATDCASACGDGGTPSSACTSCVTTQEMMGSTSTCTTAAGTSCVSDTTCSAFVSCELTCGGTP
jgi:hypothetical protein